jgi:hypothetical protein
MMMQMIKILKNIIKCIAFVSSLSFSCVAQNLPVIQNNFNNYIQNNLPEKVFVHTDRQDYLAGEIIWFKIYDVDGIYNKPLSLSKVAYVDVLDDEQNPVMQAKIALNGGIGSGSLFIPVSIKSGNYKLRAYTSWMKNFSPEYYFEEIISIVNPQVVSDIGNQQNSAGFDIQFFPEGGNLVSGIKSKLAFKAVGADGKGIDFKGAVIDQKNDTIVRFSPLKFGMGCFLFTPAKNSTYTAIISTPDNKPVIKALPPVAGEGYVMQLTDDGGGQLDISVRSNSSPASNVYIFIHTRQIVKLAKEASLNNGVVHFRFDKSLLDEGISAITLFNSERQPVCERLYFKRPADKLFINAHTDQLQYNCRNKVSVAVEAKNISGKPLNADLSMSVYRLDNFQTTPSADILSYFWLSSDLQGNVESPGYYFSNDSPEVGEAADNLMLTQGWRRFEWKNILTNKPALFSFLPETYGHLITGKIVNATTNAPAAGIITYLGVPGKRVQLFVSKSDSLGNLLFNTKDFYGDEIVVQPNTQLDSIYRIDISNPFSEQYSKRPLPPITVRPDMQEAIETQNLGMQVQNIYSGKKIRQFYEPDENSSGFYKNPIKTYLLDDYTRFTTMEEVLREYVKEVNIVKRQKRFHIKVLGEQSILNGDPLVLIDGIPEFNIDKVLAIDPLLIKKLEIVPQTYFYGPSVQQGIFSYTSYKGNLGGAEIDPHALVVDYEGLQMERVFYSPVYETEAQIKGHLPDFRNLMYWSPSVRANTNMPVSFYTSDQEGSYIGIIQGIAANGEAASSSFTFEVKK